MSEKEPVREPQKDQPANEEPLAGEPEKDQPANEHPSVEPPGAAETTVPLPTIQVEQPPLQAAINQSTASLPLIDLLAPRQPGSPSGPPPAGMPGAAVAPGAGSAGMAGMGSAGMADPAGMPGLGAAGMPGMGPAGVPVAQPGFPGGLLPGRDMTAIGDPPSPPTGPGGLGRRGWLLAAGAGGCVVLLGLIGWLAIGSLPTGEKTISSSPTAQAPLTSVIVAAGGYQFTRQSTREDADCAANAYGEMSEFFRDRPCSGLRRALFTSSIDGRPVVVSVSTVTMPDEQGAAALRRLADTNGTGNVTDLLRAGVRVPSVPEALSNPSYASAQSGGSVVIVESDYTEPGRRADDALKRIGEAAIELGHSG